MKKLKFSLKFVLKGILLTVLTCLFVLPNTGCFVSGRFTTGSINYNLYTNTTQMNKLLTDLNCNTKSMIAETGSIIRLAHNNGGPIYVSFDDNVPENIRIASIKSLDYIFGLVGEINDYYYYKVVEYDSYVSTKSNIHYVMYDESCSNIKSASAYVKRTAYGEYYATNEVNINENLVNNSANYINYVLTHELLHVFGFEDGDQ